MDLATSDVHGCPGPKRSSCVRRFTFVKLVFVFCCNAMDFDICTCGPGHEPSCICRIADDHPLPSRESDQDNC